MYASFHASVSFESFPPSQAVIGVPISGKPHRSSPPLHAFLLIIVKLLTVSDSPSSANVPGSSTRSSTPYSIKVFTRDLRRSRSFGARTLKGQLYISASSAMLFQLSFVAA